MLCTATAFRIFAYWQASPPTWTADRLIGILANLAIIGALLVAGRQLIVATLQLKDSQRTQMMSRSLDFGRRWNELDFARLRLPVYEFLETEPDLTSFLRRMENDAAFKAAVRFILNFYEEMGVAFNRGEPDPSVIRDFYAVQVEFLHKHTIAYIVHTRGQRKDERILNQFTMMRERLLQNNPH